MFGFQIAVLTSAFSLRPGFAGSPWSWNCTQNPSERDQVRFMWARLSYHDDGVRGKVLGSEARF